MKKGYKNLNEEINRMKSLMTEERLYDNFVDYVIDTIVEDDNKLIISEQGGLLSKSLDDIFTPVWRALVKGGNEVTHRSPSGVNFKIKKLEDGGVEIWRGKTKIKNPSSIGQIVDKDILQMVQKQLDKVALDADATAKYFTSGSEHINYKNHMDILLTNLQDHGLLTGTARRDILNKIESSNVLPVLKNGFFPNGRVGDGIIKTINTLDDFKVKYPRPYSYLEIIPGGTEKYIKGVFKAANKPLMSDSFYKLIKAIDGEGVENIDGIIRRGGYIQVKTKKNPIMLYKFEMSKMSQNEKRLLEEAISSGKSMEINDFLKNIDSIKTKYNVNTKPKSSEEVLSDVGDGLKFTEEDIEEFVNIGTANRIELRTAGWRNAFIDWNIKKYSNGFQKYFMNYIKTAAFKTKMFARIPQLQRVLEILPLYTRKALDASLLKKMGYKGGSGSGKFIDAGHEDVLNAIWKTTKEGDKSGSIIVRGAAEQQLYALPVGSIKPDIVKRGAAEIRQRLSKETMEVDGKKVNLGELFGWPPKPPTFGLGDNFGRWVSPSGDISRLAPAKVIRNISILLGSAGAGVYNLSTLIGYWEKLFLAWADIAIKEKIKAWVIFVEEQVPLDARVDAMRAIFINQCIAATRGQFRSAFGGSGLDKYNTWLSQVQCPSKDTMGDKLSTGAGLNDCIFWFDYEMITDVIVGEDGKKRTVIENMSITSNIDNINNDHQYQDVGKILKDNGKVYLLTIPNEDGDSYKIPLGCGGKCEEDGDIKHCGFEEYVIDVIDNFGDLTNPDNYAYILTQIGQNALEDGGDFIKATESWIRSQMKVSVEDISKEIATTKEKIETGVEKVKDVVINTGGGSSAVPDKDIEGL